jgi:hypothetical protein
MLPWEKYSTQESLPWEKYAQPEQNEPQETLEQRKARIAGYENPHPQHVGWTGQDALDILGAMAQSPERVLDGATLGYYSKYNREHGGTYEQRKQALDDLANEAGIGTINDINNFVLDAGGDIGGLGGLLFKGLSKTLKGAKLVSAASGADAAIRGWNEGDDTFNSTVNAGISGTAGAVLGPVFHYGLVGLGKAYNFLRSGGRDAYKKGVDYLKNTFGDEATNAMIKEAEESGRSLAEVVDDSGVQLLQTARQQTPEARNIINKNIEQINDVAPDKSRQLVNDAFGNNDRISTVEKLQESAKQEAQPLWDKLNNTGDLSNLESAEKPLSNYVKENDLIQQEIGKVRKDLTRSREIREASDTDFRILKAVKESLDDQINVAKNAGEKELVKRLTGQKNELVNKIDEIAPEYKLARQIYADEFQFENAIEMAKDVFSSTVDAPAFAKNFEKLSKNEQKALKLGLRDEVLRHIGNIENENVAFKKILPSNVQAKIRKAMGAKEGDKLINYARQEVKKMRNFNKLLSGSQTAEKTMLQRAADLPRKAVDVVSNIANRDRNIAIAKTMTTPDIQSVVKAYSQVTNPVGNESLYQYLTNPDPVRASLAAYFANKI